MVHLVGFTIETEWDLIIRKSNLNCDEKNEKWEKLHKWDAEDFWYEWIYKKNRELQTKYLLKVVNMAKEVKQ